MNLKSFSSIENISVPLITFVLFSPDAFGVYVCLCVREKERESVCVCVCVCDGCYEQKKLCIPCQLLRYHLIFNLQLILWLWFKPQVQFEKGKSHFEHFIKLISNIVTKKTVISGVPNHRFMDPQSILKEFWADISWIIMTLYITWIYIWIKE